MVQGSQPYCCHVIGLGDCISSELMLGVAPLFAHAQLQCCHTVVKPELFIIVSFVVGDGESRAGITSSSLHPPFPPKYLCAYTDYGSTSVPI